ncbi:hypothetical protein [Petropleomorpha daqingensis]|uniref:PH domain-containing protein n=1 Tax=Petropleomorpha daqingensis TaxID=2026353 RepID=A0A853CK48_9ACTN|nr:hypothetical protein [Petropleomorpha daqingensis]NYJ08434.1 hypothetical protein [Petropleomorpha daqingensis]
MGADAASAFLVGRLALEGRTPRVVLKASTRGPLRGTAVHVFAVADDRLWLVQPRLLGEPAIASVPLGDVAGGSVLPGSPPVVELRLGGRTVRYRALEDLDRCEEFVAALSG